MTLPTNLKHVMILTGEPSGDYHAARLVKEFKKKRSLIYFSGIGGPHLKRQDVDLFYDIENLSAMGVTEVIIQFRHIQKAFNSFKNKLQAHVPDLIILVDYPGFNLMAARYVKEHYNVKVLYYITPKVWAWKKSRLKIIKKYVDHAALIFPFEEIIFKKAGIPATYVGNPLVEEYPEIISRPFLNKKTFDLNSNEPITIGLLPGSRNAEIKNLLNVMIQSAGLIHEKQTRVRFLISKASSIGRAAIDKHVSQAQNPQLFKIVEGPVREIFDLSDLIIAASGTVTLEAGLFCIPTLLIYKMAKASYWAAKLFVKVKYAGLVNLIVNEKIMPELLQNDATPEKISEKILYMLSHTGYYQTRLKTVRKKLGQKGAAKNAAGIAATLLREAHFR